MSTFSFIYFFHAALAAMFFGGLSLVSVVAEEIPLSQKAVEGKKYEAYSVPVPRLSPRPEWIFGIKAPCMSLNGVWQFDATGTGEFKDINVPSEWKMEGFDVPKGKFATYKKHVDLPSSWGGKRIKLRFDAVHAVCRVLVNGVEVGGHEGGFVPFELDITQAVKVGKNHIELKVQSESEADSIACISQYAAHQVGGIIRKVTLFALPDWHQCSSDYKTTLDEQGGQATLTYNAGFVNEGDTLEQGVFMISLKDAQGKVVVTEKKEISLNPDERSIIDVKMSVKDAHLWTSETPYLYTLESSLEKGGKAQVRYSSRIGLREIEVRGVELFVNKLPVKLMGVNRHEVHPLRGRSLTPELCRRDAELYKAANVNLVRTSHYPASEEFYAACDELGLFVESEAAVCWVGHGASPVWTKWDINDPQYFVHILRANYDHIVANRNHPSILMWSMGNESLWTPLWATVWEKVKMLQNSRPVTFHDQCVGAYNNGKNTVDVANYHYPSENNFEEWNKQGRPSWFGEYVHLQCYNRRELETDAFIQADWGRPVQRMVDLMWETQGCLGGAIWSGIDDVFCLPDGTFCGYGYWGPIDGWRREKPEYHGMRMAYTPLRIFSVEAKPDQPIRLNVQNRLNFLNLNQTDIVWKTEDKKGVVTANIAPHARGEMVIENSFKAGARIVISLLDKEKGTEYAREVVTVEGGELGSVGKNREINPVIFDEKVSQLVVPKEKGASLSLPVPIVLALNNSGGADTAGGRVLSDDVEAFSDVEDWTWKQDKNKDATLGAEKKWHFSGEGALGKGTLIITEQAAGGIKMEYSLVVKEAIDPRQWGMVFALPKSFDTVEWDRNDHWSWSPNSDIGRSQGYAKANPTDRKFMGYADGAPAHAWKEDANKLGSRDFRSTRSAINYCCLKDEQGNAWSITPANTDKKGSAPVATRAWVDGDVIRLLVAGFNTGGTDHFFNTHYSGERRPIQAGESIQGEFILKQESAR